MKAALRTTIREAMRAMPADQRQNLSAQLSALLRSQPLWRNAHSILGYSPLADEPDIAPLLDEVLAGGKKIHLPRYESRSDSYVICEVRSRAELTSGRFGVLEPGAGHPVSSLKHLDFILVPGVAFDLAGRRLGRGKGFYDRLLTEVSGHKCGVCFDAQIVPEVPEEPHDIRLNSIITPTCWHVMSARGMK